MANEMDKQTLFGDKGEKRIMATPIAPTPVLKGQDLVRLVKDLSRPDNNKDQRQKALKALMDISRNK